MLALLTVAKGLVEFAALLLFGQGIVYVISFGRHEGNPVYRMMRFLTRPVVSVARALAPRFVVDQHIPALAFILLFWLWIGLKLAQIHYQSQLITQGG